MAFPIIAASATTASTVGVAVAVNMPAGIVAGNLLIVVAAHQDDFLLSASPQWEPIALVPNGPNVSLNVFARIAQGGDTCTLTGDVARDKAVVAFRVTGHGVKDVNLALLRGTSIGLDLSPNPPALASSRALDYLWVEAFAADDDDDTSPYESTSFTPLAQIQSAASATSCLAAVASRALQGDALDPGVMAMAAAEEWVALTLAIPPIVDLAAASLESALVFAGTLTDNPLAAVLGASGTFTIEDLTTDIRMAAVSTSTGAVVSALTTEIPLDSAISGTATVTASLTSAIPIAAILEGTVSVGADLTAYLPLFANTILGTGLFTAFLAVIIVPGISRETLSLTGIDNEIFTVTN